MEGLPAATGPKVLPVSLLTLLVFVAGCTTPKLATLEVQAVPESPMDSRLWNNLTLSVYLVEDGHMGDGEVSVQMAVRVPAWPAHEQVMVPMQDGHASVTFAFTKPSRAGIRVAASVEEGDYRSCQVSHRFVDEAVAQSGTRVVRIPVHVVCGQYVP